MDPRGSRVGKAGERVAQLGVCDAGTQGHRGWGPRGTGVGGHPEAGGPGEPMVYHSPGSPRLWQNTLGTVAQERCV